MNGKIFATLRALATALLLTLLSPLAQGFAIDTTSTSISPMTGLWNNVSEDGWGTMIVQQYDMMFVTTYTYDSSGNPLWYVASNCAVSGDHCSGSLYKVVGGTVPTVAWNGAAKQVSLVGSVTVSFSDVDHGTMALTINGASSTKSFARFLFATPGTAAPPGTGFTVDQSKASTSSGASPISGLWNNASEDGWGTMIVQQYGMMFATMYTYDAAGNPLWYVAPSCAVSANRCSGSLYRVSGGTPPTVTWNGANKVVSAVGTVTVTFANADSGSMALSINGASATKSFARSVFRGPPAPTSATAQEVRDMVNSTLSVVTGAGGADVTTVLSDILTALFSSTPSTCPAVTLSPANLDLSNPPPTISFGANYPSGCRAASGATMSGSATLGVTNLNLNGISGNFSLTLNNLLRNGVLLGNGQLTGSLSNVALDSTSGNLTSGTISIQFTNFLLSNGETFNGTLAITVVNATTVNVSTNMTTSNGPLNLNLQLTQNTTSGVSTVRTTSTGTIRTYSAQINNLQLNPTTCKNYPIGGSIVFTKASQTATVTFNASCDGNYTYSGP